MLGERAVGRAERLHSIREFEESIEAFFSGKLHRQDPDPCKARREQQQLVIRFKQVKEKDCSDRIGCDFWQENLLLHLQICKLSTRLVVWELVKEEPDTLGALSEQAEHKQV